MKTRRPLILLSILALLALSAASMMGANGLNARFIRWPVRSNVIHIFGLAEEGRPGFGPAIVKEGQWVLFGFEWWEPTIEELQAFIDKPEHDIEVSIDGGEAFSVKDWYQDAFVAEAGSGPRWSWDHDGDGPGDGNENGADDWNGPHVFFRYLYSGLSVGTHTFEFTIIDPEFDASDFITVEVVAD